MSGDMQFRGAEPYLYYEEADQALEWLARVFGFQEKVRYVDADGAVQEAEMTVGDTSIHISGAEPGYWERQGSTGPVGHTTIVHLGDVDAHHARATAAGAKAEPPEDKPYGARVYSVTDPGGHDWTFWQRMSDEVRLPEGWRELRP